MTSWGISRRAVLATGAAMLKPGRLRADRAPLPEPELIDIGGRKLALRCAGAGGPAVIFESGLTGNAVVWYKTLPGVAAMARACAYDRAGLGLSDPAPPPRTAGDAANDLYALLDGSGISGPYVVVGASFGGYIARLFAAGFPREVAGLVLVDASHEDQAERLAEVLDPAQLETLLLDAPNNIEGMDLPRTWAEMHHADPIPEVPLVVLSAGREKPVPPGFPKQEFNQIWRELQDDLATLAPAAIHRWVDTNHDIALDRPQEVVDAVRWVLEQIGAASPCDRSSTS